jgi:adenine-specific DNA-methyltransferase
VTDARLTATRTAAAHASFEVAGFSFDPARSYGDASSENLVVHGDHLAALAALAPRFAGQVRLAYVDPPYNTGRAFAEYDDDCDPETWRARTLALLEGTHPLMAADGALFLQIGDRELGQALETGDRVFGRKNRVSLITVVRSAATGHKAQNTGPVNVSDFIVMYARERARLRAVPQVKARVGLDPAYSTWLENPADPPKRWSYAPLARTFARTLGHASTALATRALGRAVFRGELTRFALANRERVVRFAQPRYEAVSNEARAAIDRSRAEPAPTFVLERPGYKCLFLHHGDRVLFLADKVRVIDGELAQVEPLTNVWDDIRFQGIAGEGGVVFPRNKKPERLMQRLLAMTSEPGDWVLDPCLGSGTTAAVAQKMQRRWIGVERGGHLDTLALPRLRRVIDGLDDSGVTRSCGWSGGGGFRVHA